MEPLQAINLKTKSAYNKAAQKYYDLFYDELDKKPFDKEIIDTSLNYLNPGSIFCDAGCCLCGYIENYISKKGFVITGIDISERCIEIAREHFPEIKYETGDFSNLKYDDNSIDGIISYHSIIDAPKIYLSKIFKEFNRVLKREGLLILAVKEGEEEGNQEELPGIEAKIYLYADEIQINRIF